MAADILAEAYPELEAVHGKVTWYDMNGEPCEWDHAWNVRRDGLIVDSTFDPRGKESVYYWLEDGSEAEATDVCWPNVRYG